GGLLNYSYLSGENITNMPEGRPLFVRDSSSNFSLANFIQSHLYAAFATLKIGMDILKEENINIDVLIAQGGMFKTPVIAQQVLSNALNMPITVMNTASEGGAWGMAILAKYVNYKHEDLETFLDQKVFSAPESSALSPEPKGVEGYETFIKKYKKGLPIESVAINSIESLKFFNSFYYFTNQNLDILKRYFLHLHQIKPYFFNSIEIRFYYVFMWYSEITLN